MKTSINDLVTKGFMKVKYPHDWRKEVKVALAAWKDFTDLPLEVKKNLPYSNNSRGVGYEYKDGSGFNGDYKENFDVSLGGEKWLEENIVNGKITHPQISNFLHSASRLIPLVSNIALDFARDAEEELGVTGLYDEVYNGKDDLFIRLIHYFGEREVGEEIASAHVDQGGYTPHLIESAPGLQFLTYEGEWIDAPISEEETVIIPSMQLQLRSKGKLRAMAHRVVATKETAKKGRYSAVCFVGLKNTSNYDKAKWGRLQEMKPGFNYQIPHPKFKKYFKS